MPCFGLKTSRTVSQEQPFRPLRIIASEGLHYGIYHPDLVFLGQRDLMIGFPGPDDPKIYDRLVRVALVHVVALEGIPAPASKNGPG